MSKFDNIKVSSRMDEIISNAIKQGRDIKYKKRKKGLMISSAASILLVLGIAAIGIKNPSFAQRIPIIRDVISVIQESVENGELSDSSTRVNTSCTKNGLTVTVENAYYENNMIFMSLELKADKPFNKTKYAKALVADNKDGSIDDYALMFNEWKTWVNGKETLGRGFESPRFYYTDKYTLKGNMMISFRSPIEEHDEYDIFKMKFDLRETEYDRKNNNYQHIKNIEGPWTLEFPVKSNKDKAKVITPNIKQDIITVEKITVNQTSLNIKLDLEKEGLIEYVEVIDDNGNLLDGGMGSSKPRKIDLDFGLSSINQEVKYITILAYSNVDHGKDKSSAIEIKVNLE